MPRNRIIYQSEGVFVGQKTPATGQSYTEADIKEIYRVQSANYGFNLGRKDVNQFGELAVIDRVVVDAPTVTLDLTYLIANVYNENVLGFNVGTSPRVFNIFTGIFGGGTDMRTYWIKTVGYGVDLHGAADTGYAFGVIGIGNAYITDYTIEAQVGEFPRATVRMAATNMKFDNWQAGDLTAICPNVASDGTSPSNLTYTLPSGTSTTSAVDQTTVTKPGDIRMTWDTNASNMQGASINDSKIQSFTLTTNVSRTPLRKIGQTFPFSQEINFPVNCSLRVTADVGDMNTGALPGLIADTGKSTVKINILAPTGNSVVNFGCELRGAQLDSQEYSSAIGNNKTVTLNWTAPCGGINDVIRGIWISGLL